MLIYGDTMEEATGIRNWTIYPDSRMVINPFFTGMCIPIMFGIPCIMMGTP